MEGWINQVSAIRFTKSNQKFILKHEFLKINVLPEDRKGLDHQWWHPGWQADVAGRLRGRTQIGGKQQQQQHQQQQQQQQQQFVSAGNLKYIWRFSTIWPSIYPAGLNNLVSLILYNKN